MLRNRPNLMSSQLTALPGNILLGTSSTLGACCMPCKPPHCRDYSSSIVARGACSVLHPPTKGEGVSSTTFWCRRWMEHSRSGSVTMVPLPSPKICTSMCRARCTYFSTNTPESPKLALPCLQHLECMRSRTPLTWQLSIYDMAPRTSQWCRALLQLSSSGERQASGAAQLSTALLLYMAGPRCYDVESSFETASRS